MPEYEGRLELTWTNDYAEALLVVHLDAPDVALAALAAVKEDSSPVGIIISVGMLKEGWDVRNVNVDKEIDSADVIRKREAAKRWANHVSADSAVGQSRKYLLAPEADVKTARGSWRTLKQLAS